jgi:hypothetical protein
MPPSFKFTVRARHWGISYSLRLPVSWTPLLAISVAPIAVRSRPQQQTLAQYWSTCSIILHQWICTTESRQRLRIPYPPVTLKSFFASSILLEYPLQRPRRLLTILGAAIALDAIDCITSATMECLLVELGAWIFPLLPTMYVGQNSSNSLGGIPPCLKWFSMMLSASIAVDRRAEISMQRRCSQLWGKAHNICQSCYLAIPIYLISYPYIQHFRLLTKTSMALLKYETFYLSTT